MTQQPIWKYIANLGDTNPLQYGGAFLYIDTTGVYPPELEVYTPNEIEETGGEVHRVSLEQLLVNWDGGSDSLNRMETSNPNNQATIALSCNRFHPRCEEWFATAERLESVSSSVGIPIPVLVGWLCNSDPVKRASGYLELFSTFGIHEFDQYPLVLSESEVEERYKNLEVR